MAFGQAKWVQYFGDVGVEPPLPSQLREALNAPCPFWSSKKVEETHLLVLIPKTIDGQPFTLNRLGELIQNPKQGHKTKYDYYDNDVKNELGSGSPSSSYWVLMTRDVIPGSRSKSYQDQVKLVQSYSSYELPGALEAAIAILMEHVVSGKRLYGDNPYTYTRCQEKVNDSQWPVTIGGFAAGGLGVDYYYDDDYDHDGVGALRK